MVVRHWAPLDRVSPDDKANTWAAEHGISAPHVILCTGTLGREQRLLILECAQRFRSRGDTLLVVVTDDVSAAFLTGEARARGLDKLVAFPFQPYGRYQQVLASADILLCLVRAQDGVLSVPSKLACYLCSGRAVVLSAPSENIAADIIRESGAGIVVDPGNAEAICQAAGTLIDDAAVRNKAAVSARAYAERHFDITPITDQFERLFERVVAGPPRQT